MRLYGLIGYPLTHSFSSGFFNEKFRNEGLNDCEYKNFPLQRIEDLRELIENNNDLAGFNVTTPHKISVMRYIDEIDETASKIGAVNTVKIEFHSGKKLLKGYNTDASGFAALINDAGDIKGSKVLILGTGGASMAVRYVFEQMKLPYSFVSATNKNYLAYSEINNNIIASHRIIVNTTPLGMFPDISGFPELPYEFISKNHIGIDLIYNPPDTLFLKKILLKGAVAINGLKMLHVQAEKAWEIWNS